MNQSSILVVDDDSEDLEMIEEAFKQLNITRPVQYFKTGDELLNYLKSSNVSPFLIICDLYLPGETGFEIKERLTADEQLRYQAVPFIYWSTSASEKQIQHAYDLPAQGFFFKASNFNELCDTLKIIIDYWEKSKHPKNVV
ncbi:MAG TPA: response regulator [Parafilimonas sp.]|nr:response regulator [Parafilimonas sp.]